VGVPFEQVIVDSMPSRVESNKADGSVKLEMDLQGTANCKAPNQ